MVYIKLYRGTGLINSLIRWQTRSHYAHAAIQIDEHIYEALPFKGVIRRFTRSADMAADTFLVAYPDSLYTDRLTNRVRSFLEEQVGKGYDFAGVVRFVTREKAKDDDTWFCSELVYEALRQAGMKLLRCDESWKVSPGLLALAPSLHSIASRGNPPKKALK
jgi:uncharacterized protein YycO